MKCTGLKPRMEETRNSYKNFVVKVKGNVHLEELGVDGIITVKCVLNVGCGLNLCYYGQEQMAGSCEPLGSIPECLSAT